MKEIKNCPCCGHEAHYYRIGPKDIITCSCCGLRMEQLYGNKYSIINDWNKRTN